MKKKLKVSVLIHKGLLPPDSKSEFSEEEKEEWKVEYDVISTIKKSGHEVYPVEMFGELEPLRKNLDEVKPDLAFNLLEEFKEFPLFDQQVTNYLELKKIPYTGCNPRGLMIAKDKALSKKILAFHNIKIPSFEVFPLRKKFTLNVGIKFPLFVKSLSDEGSVGISEASLVRSEEKLKERVEFLHKQNSTDVIAEEFIEGREIYVGVMGNSRLTVFPPWELILENYSSDTPIATSKLKWDTKYQKKVGLVTKAAKLNKKLQKEFEQVSKVIFRSLHLSGYARIDYRLTPENEIYLIEANPNPFLAKDEDFAASAKHIGISYIDLIKRIINNGLNYKPF
jgi:D-alanine-D-alanine ligase